jgi:hypothetical protein
MIQNINDTSPARPAIQVLLLGNRAYPLCETAKATAAKARTATLTPRAIERLMREGVDVIASLPSGYNGRLESVTDTLIADLSAVYTFRGMRPSRRPHRGAGAATRQ